jgi:hypothetical protein
MQLNALTSLMRKLKVPFFRDFTLFLVRTLVKNDHANVTVKLNES